MDDFAITVVSNSARNNCRKLKQIAEHLVSLGKENAIEFDIGKTELIHFHNKHTEVQNSLEFLGTTIQPKKVVRWLGIFLDSKLTFKTHVEKKLGAAQTALYLITRLGNTQRGLSLQALRQLYYSCVNSIADYGVPIWWNKKSKGFLVDKY